MRLDANNIAFITHLPNRAVEIEGKSYLYFSGTSYLGLPQNEQFRNLLQKGATVYGNVYGSSRNGNLQLEIYNEAEALLSQWSGANKTLTISSGMLAGQVAVHYLLLKGYEFIYSPDIHPATWHKPQIDTPKISFQEWATVGLWQQLEALTSDAPICIVSNTTDALRGKIYDFEWVNRLPKNRQITLLLDDSHGIGVSGDKGRGVWQRVPKFSNLCLIVTASLAKAMGLSGGILLSDDTTLDGIRHTAFFGGCSPMAPYQLYAWTKGVKLYEQGYQKLQANIQQFVNYIQDLELFSYTQGYPVFYTVRNDLYTFLLQKNILIYSFSYPKPTDTPNTRIVISAWHTSTDIEQLGIACRAFCQT